MPLDRRTFLQIAAVPAIASATDALPSYRQVTQFKPSGSPGMPGPFRGHVVRLHAEKSIDSASEKADAAIVRQMVSQGMRALTGAGDDRAAWARFFLPEDIIGIKVNCSGAPGIMSTPEVVGTIVDNLVSVGVRPGQIHIYERFLDQLTSVHYDRYVPKGVPITAVETPRGSIAGYDPKTYVEVDFFGEEDTRSNMVRLVTEKFTKIINVPNMKDHGAAGVTGCLKNIAYGNYANVARSHRNEKTNTLSFIGTLASMEPLRSRTVLHIMDGLRGVWHGGPFSYDRKYRFYPKQMMIGTDPVAMDRLLVDVIEDKRRAEGAVSVWDRSPSYIRPSGSVNPRTNVFIREPGHIEYAGKLGLGVYDKQQIQVKSIEI